PYRCALSFARERFLRLRLSKQTAEQIFCTLTERVLRALCKPSWHHIGVKKPQRKIFQRPDAATEDFCRRICAACRAVAPAKAAGEHGSAAQDRHHRHIAHIFRKQLDALFQISYAVQTARRAQLFRKWPEVIGENDELASLELAQTIERSVDVFK